jgi:hypothetical protein
LGSARFFLPTASPLPLQWPSATWAHPSALSFPCPMPRAHHVHTTAALALLCRMTLVAVPLLPLLWSSRALRDAPLSHLAVASSARPYLSTTSRSAPPFWPLLLPPNELADNRLSVLSKTSIQCASTPPPPDAASAHLPRRAAVSSKYYGFSPPSVNSAATTIPANSPSPMRVMSTYRVVEKLHGMAGILDLFPSTVMIGGVLHHTAAYHHRHLTVAASVRPPRVTPPSHQAVEGSIRARGSPRYTPGHRTQSSPSVVAVLVSYFAIPPSRHHRSEPLLHSYCLAHSP